MSAAKEQHIMLSSIGREFPRYAATFDADLRKVLREAFLREQSNKVGALATKKWKVLLIGAVVAIAFVFYCVFATGWASTRVAASNLTAEFHGTVVLTSVVLVLTGLVIVGWRRHVTGIRNDSLWYMLKSAGRWGWGVLVTGAAAKTAAPYLDNDENYLAFLDKAIQRTV